MDEFGETFSLPEFTEKIGIKIGRYSSKYWINPTFPGAIFPNYVTMTTDFKLRTNIFNNECMCLCKSIDVPIWPG